MGCGDSGHSPTAQGSHTVGLSSCWEKPGSGSLPVLLWKPLWGPEEGPPLGPCLSGRTPAQTMTHGRARRGSLGCSLIGLGELSRWGSVTPFPLPTREDLVPGQAVSSRLWVGEAGSSLEMNMRLSRQAVVAQLRPRQVGRPE